MQQRNVERRVRYPDIPALSAAGRKTASEALRVLDEYERGRLSIRQAAQRVVDKLEADSLLRSLMFDDFLGLHGLLAGSADVDLSQNKGHDERVDHHLATLRDRLRGELRRR